MQNEKNCSTRYEMRVTRGTSEQDGLPEYHYVFHEMVFYEGVCKSDIEMENHTYTGDDALDALVKQVSVFAKRAETYDCAFAVIWK